MSKPKVFISYSHVDEKRWKNRLQRHLEVSAMRDSLIFWEDRQIAVGSEWRAEIKTAIESAQAAILLISVDFLHSNFIRDEEVPVIMQRRIRDGMKVFPLIVRSCSWKMEEWLSQLQVRPTDGKPLAKYKGDDIDQVLHELVDEIVSLLKQPQPNPLMLELETQKSPSAPPADDCPYVGRIRSLALSTIAQALAESGKIVESLSIARKVGEAEERATTLAFIAEAFAGL